MTKKLLVLALLLFPLAFTACGGDGSDDPGITPDAGTLSCSMTEIAASARGGSYSVTVAASRGSWDAYSEADWVTIAKANTASATGTVSVTVAANASAVSRQGTITVKSGTARATITVTQQAPLQTTKTSLYFSSRGDSQTVGVTASADWTFSGSEAWLTVVKTDAATLTVSAAPNDATTSRTVTITIASGDETITISVTQDSAEDRNITAPAGYHLVWHDEFSEGTTLNTTDWRHEVQSAGWVNHELQTYVNGSADGQRVTEIADGRLRINCFKGSDGKIYSGRVYARSTTGWQYGYIEARIKLPKGRGTWPAFWMMPVNFTGWPDSGEIDIMEEVGADPNQVSSSLHANAHVHSNNTQVTAAMNCPGAEDDFHVYAMEWTHENITTYVDGKKLLSYNNRGLGHDDWPYDAPFYIILNVAWGGDWGGYKGVDQSALPVTMMVDYVRVFQKD